MERLRIKDEEEEEARTQLKQQAAKVTNSDSLSCVLISGGGWV